MTHIVREFDTPITAVDPSVPTPNPQALPQTVLVEDSVEHQAGDGKTAGMSPSMETPDIFDNRPQAVVETQLDEDVLVNPKPVELTPNNGIKPIITGNQAHIAPMHSDNLAQVVSGENDIVPALNTLPDGTVDIPRRD